MPSITAEWDSVLNICGILYMHISKHDFKYNFEKVLEIFGRFIDMQTKNQLQPITIIDYWSENTTEEEDNKTDSRSSKGSATMLAEIELHIVRD